MCRMPSWAIYDSTTKSQLSSFLCLVESSQKFFEKSLGCDSNLSAAMHNEPQDVATGMALRNCSRENFERTLHKVMTPHEWIINTNDGFDRSLGWFRWKFTQNKWKRTYYSTNLSGWKKKLSLETLSNVNYAEKCSKRTKKCKRAYHWQENRTIGQREWRRYQEQ